MKKEKYHKKEHLNQVSFKNLIHDKSFEPE